MATGRLWAGLLAGAAAAALASQAATAEDYFYRSKPVSIPARTPNLAASPAALPGLDVAAPATRSAPRTVTVTNSGGPTKDSVAPQVSGPFEVASTDCGASLGRDASCSVEVVATAASNGALEGALTIPGLGRSIPLSGTASGFVAAAAIEPPTATASVVGGNSPSTPAVLTVRNTGHAPSGAIQLSLTSGATSFAIVAGGTCTGASVPAGGTCTVYVARTATANDATARSATVRAAFAGGQSATATVSGTAAGFDPAISIGTGALTVAAISGATPGACTNVILTNVGKGAGAAGGTLTITGTNAAQFGTCTASVTPCNASALAPNASCNLGIRLVATANGTYTATVGATASGLTAPSRVASATATGLVPVISVASSVNVAEITDGSAAGACTNVAVTNSGPVAGLSGLTASFSGTDAASFRTCTPTGTACSATALAPNQSCNLGVQFLATASGSKSATMTVAASGATSKTATVQSSASGFLTCTAPGQACGDGSYLLSGSPTTGTRVRYGSNSPYNSHACPWGHSLISLATVQSNAATVAAIVKAAGKVPYGHWSSTVQANGYRWVFVVNSYSDAAPNYGASDYLVPAYEVLCVKN